jgi:hypothetical protein
MSIPLFKRDRLVMRPGMPELLFVHGVTLTPPYSPDPAEPYYLVRDAFHRDAPDLVVSEHAIVAYETEAVH